jgi:hypothetical protein
MKNINDFEFFLHNRGCSELLNYHYVDLLYVYVCVCVCVLYILVHFTRYYKYRYCVGTHSLGLSKNRKFDVNQCIL